MFLCQNSKLTEPYSALILPRVHEDTGVELRIHEGRVWILSLEILFVHSQAEGSRFLKHVVAMKILICSFWEVILV